MVSIKNNRGSSTIEAALIMSALLLIMVTLVFTFMLLYQRALLNKVAALAAQQGSEIWTDARKDIYSGYMENREDLSLSQLYQQLFDFDRNDVLELEIYNDESTAQPAAGGTQQDVKVQKITQMIRDELARGLLKPQTTSLKISFSNNVLERKIEVSILQKIGIPLSGVQTFFSGEKTMNLTGTGTAVVVEPDEYIRNIDLGVEYANRAMKMLSLENKLKEFKDKLLGGR